ncbi:hypothetical protein KAR91_57815 [Candidatus Pacearchaeota archaeon]|nr:hypothetical protein [Candidatus Pacearchaeota archaeon]
MLSKALNQYAEGVTSKLYTQRVVIPIADYSCDYDNGINMPVSELDEAICWADIIHLHNTGPGDWDINDCFKKKPYIIQLHSYNPITERLYQRYKANCVTIAQKHATLYNLPYVPNIIPLDEDRYQPRYNATPPPVNIVYSPSNTSEPRQYNGTCGKGFKYTTQVLNQIISNHPGTVKVKIFNCRPKIEVLRAKQEAHIVIDEIKTGGFHLSGLEGLTAGCIVIGNLNPLVKQVIHDVSGSPFSALPWVEAESEELLSTLESLIVMSKEAPDKFFVMQKKGREWMEKYWHPRDLVKHHLKLYQERLGR